MKHKQAHGSIWIIASMDGAIQWHTARTNPGSCWKAFSAEIAYSAPKNRRAAIRRAKRDGWRCAQIWAQELFELYRCR